MDYEKKYNHALEVVRELQKDWASTQNRAAREIELAFPELKESEEEGIRKFIIDCIDELRRANADNAEFNGRCGEAIAYLEKQKEQKRSLNFDAISSWLRDHVSRYVNSEFNEFHHCTEYDGTINVERLIADLKVAVDSGTFDVDAAFDARKPKDNWEYIKEFCDKFGRIPKDMDELDELVSYVMVKKQKEQKPIISAEESLGISQGEYNKIVDECIFGEHKEQKSIEDAAKEATKDKESAEKFLKTAGIVDENGNLAEIYRSEQNPVETNEGDKRIRESIEGAIRVYGKTQGQWLGGYDMDTLVIHLREAFSALEKQKEQKPAENDTRTKIISKATNEKQVVLLSESNGNEEIEWDTRSLKDTKKLLEHGIAFINKQLGTNPAEWSEEDEDNLTAVKTAVYDYFDEGYAEELYTWLKSSLPQPKEERVKMLQDIYNKGKEISKRIEMLEKKIGLY